MKYKKLLFILFLSVFAIGGCASSGIPKQEYYSRLGKVELGMSKAEFKQLFPESIPRGAKQYPRGTVEVFEVSYKYYSFFPTGNPRRDALTGMEEQPQWFYFYNGFLIQYGNPEDWPSDPDIIIEQRIR